MISVTVFNGIHDRTIDQKGRVILPRNYRNYLSEGLYLAPWKGPCLKGIPKLHWPEWEKKFENMQFGDEGAADFETIFFGLLEDVPKVDNQGRLFISKELMEHAGLKKEVVIQGRNKTFDIWDKKSWNSRYEKARKSFAQSIETLQI